MTISTSVGRKFTVGQLVTMAFHRAGQVEMTQVPSAAQLSAGRAVLETIIDKLEVYNVSARATQFVTLELEAGTSEYTLDRVTVDVLSGKYIPADQSRETPNTESYVTVLSREQWQSLSSRDTPGQPTMMYAHKEFDEIRLRLWPTPDEDGAIRLLTGRRLADVDRDDATLDLEGYWNEYLIQKLAGNIAESSTADKDKIVRLQMSAAAELREARARSTQQLDGQVVVEHGGGR